jgi:MoxR-like ATPase
MGLKFYFTNKVSDEFQLKGFVDANGNYQETALYKAFKHGGVFMLDEMDASDPAALVVINSVLSDRYFTFPNGEFVEAHEDFVAIAGANTWGTGATYQYTGRNQLDAATRNRFITVKIDYSPTIEESLTSDSDLLSFIRKFRECCKNFGINHVVSYRNIITLDMYVDAVGVDDVLEDGLIQNLEKDDLTMLYGEFRQPIWRDNRWAKSFVKMCS